MKRILLSFAFLFSVLIATAQDACLNDVVNTLKDRISLAGYAQVGYTYDDADDGSNTFDIKRVIFMAQGKSLTDGYVTSCTALPIPGKYLKHTPNTNSSPN